MEGTTRPMSARDAALREDTEIFAPGKLGSPHGAAFTQVRSFSQTDLLAGLAGIAAFVGRGPQQQDSRRQWPQLQYWA